MNLKPIKNDADYQLALKRLEDIFDAPIGTIESDEADILGLMIDEYEQKNFSIETPDPIEAIKIRMEDLGLKQIDLVKEFGSKSRISEVLGRKRRLTIDMIRKLSKRLSLSPGLLISDYHLNRFPGVSKSGKHAKTNQ